MIPVAFDLRDPDRSGIARVARSLARAFLQQFGGGDEFQVTLAGPPGALDALGVAAWGRRPARVVSWDAPRYSLRAERQWSRVRHEAGSAVWWFPHWDVPWHSRPERYVATVHDVAHLRVTDVPRWRRAVARRWMRRATLGARAISVVSRFTATEIAALWPDLRDRIHVIPNGVDELFFGAAPPLPQSLEARLDGAPFMLSVGVRKPHKNLAVGVDVLAGIPGLRWVVVGEWFPHWDRVGQRARARNVSGRLVELDRVDDTTLCALYHRAACLLFSSRYEGFGLPIAEALAAGTPVVIADTPGSVETLGGCGWICAADRPADFSRAVAEILALGAARADYATKARARARQFTWPAAAARLADMLRRAA